MRVMAMAAAAIVLLTATLATTARAEVDIRTPWANVYVGPDGVYVNGPWGRVEIPKSERARVCRKWRQSVTEHYKERNCSVTFDAKGCTIEEVDCEK